NSFEIIIDLLLLENCLLHNFTSKKENKSGLNLTHGHLWSKIYGPVMTVYMGPWRAVVLVGYDTVKEALVDQADDFTGRGPIPFLVRANRGYGLVISNGERWRQLRRFTLTTLRDFGMGRKGMEEWIQEVSSQLIDRIQSTNAKPFDPTFFLSCSVSNVICCMVFGERFSYDDDQFLQLLQITADTIKFGSSPWGQLYNIFPGLMEWLPGRHNKVFADIEKMRGFVLTKIQAHRETLDPSSPRDYIDCFLNRISQEKDNPTTEFHEDNLVSTVLNLFLAGTESTSSTIRYALSVLIKYPKIQEAMQQEIDTVLGQKRSPRMEDRKSLPFTDAVLHEIQRFMDIVPMGAPHYALSDISFRGYTIPKVFNCSGLLPLTGHYNPSPAALCAERGEPVGHALDVNKSDWAKQVCCGVPGKRACVGESLARMEIFLFMVSLLQTFTFSSPGGPDSIDLNPEYSSFANVPRRYLITATPRWE
uniref:Cytochrome P450 2F3-like n=1 Tax=Salarias fasciatus TaxID=181472 RepID=A0A672IS83_SALFA